MSKPSSVLPAIWSIGLAVSIFTGTSNSAPGQLSVSRLPGPNLTFPVSLLQQEEAKQPADGAVQVAPEQEETKKPGEGTPANSEQEDANLPMLETDNSNTVQPGDREIRLTLWDGSVVTGDLGVASVHIDTKFGTLEVPVANIQFLRPGLESNPTLNSQITGLVEKLGDKEFQVREQAHRQLLAMGLSLRSQLNTFVDGGSAERKKHLQVLREEIEQLAEDQEGNSVEEQPLEREDSITTGQFTMVGKIRETQFSVKTRYGELAIELRDIRSGDRAWGNVATSIRKSFDIEATAFFQRKPTGTRIRLKQGDRVTIRATGSVNWTNWGNVSSTPEGLPNQGQWNGISCGALVAMVGKSGEPIKIGDKGEFVAKTGGELILGIAMQDSYASQEGYTWVGKYTARVVVEPGEK